jgi:hypothetical protein
MTKNGAESAFGTKKKLCFDKQLELENVSSRADQLI